MEAHNPDNSEYTGNQKAIYLVDIPEIEKEDGTISTTALITELKEYIYAVQEKKISAERNKKYDLVPILETVAADMGRIIKHYENGDLSFNKCYEEVVSLYVFIEIYFKFDHKR